MEYIQQPQAIEAKSFVIISEIIASERPDYRFAGPLQEAIIKRVIHTTADFDYADSLAFSPNVIEKAKAALEKEIARTSGKLNNKGFLAKAPEDVVAKEKEKLAEFEEKMKSFDERLRFLADL